MKTCTRCKQDKPYEEFYFVKGKPGSWCRICCAEHSKKYYNENKEKRQAYNNRPEVKAAKAASDRRYAAKNAEKLASYKAAYYQENKEAAAAYARERYLHTSDVVKRRTAEWKINNRSKHNAKCMERHTRKLMACPAWLDEDQKWMIEEIYDLAIRRTNVTGVKHHVDHIVPLQHKLVCGLHVPWNLQVITASENCSKRNSFVG